MSVKVYKTLVVNLKIINVKTEEIVRDVTRTIDGADRRKWISDTVMWATLNGCYVEIINKDDDTEDLQLQHAKIFK